MNQKKKNETPEGRERRLRAFKHNAMLGWAGMTITQMQGIQNSPTASDEAKKIAGEIINLSQDLKIHLKTRVDSNE